MSFALALFYHPEPGHEAPPDGAALRSRLAQLGGLQDALIFTPAAAQDRYVDDGPPPMLGLQLHFARLEDLEAAACAGGGVQGLAGLADRAHHTPGALSAGEQQPCAMARALFPQPALILADEPTGNLDAENAQAILAAMRDFAQAGGSVLMATHSDAAQAAADRALRLAAGRLAD